MKRFSIILITMILAITASTQAFAITTWDKGSNISEDYSNVAGVVIPDGATIEQKNAIRHGEDYLEAMPFSYNGLVDQLVYEGYSYADAVYACNILYQVNTDDLADENTFEPLKKGSKGDKVKYVQSRLIDLGFLSGGADGIFGSGTESAVLKFQVARGLKRTGIVDVQTYNELCANIPEYQYSESDAESVDDENAIAADTRYRLISTDNLATLDLNEQNNKQNEGTFLIHNGWIYGQSFDSNGNSQFVKVRTDYTDWTVLDNGLATHINIVDNYIYYMLFAEDYGIYRIKTSGEDRELIAKAFGSMQIVDDQIYYTDYMYNGEYDDLSGDDSYYHLYRCNLSGEHTVDVIAKPTFHAYVYEDCILYQDDRDNMSLHICDLNGQNDIKLNDKYSYFPIFDGQYIYYVQAEDHDNSAPRTLWRMRTDGTEQAQLSTCEVGGNMLLTDEYIYFTNYEDSSRLYRVNKDGSNLTLITQDKNIGMVVFLDKYIKYTKYTDDGYIDDNYICEYDGSGKRVFEK